MSRAGRNIRASYVYGFFSMFLVIIPVIVPWFTSLGLSMKQIFEVQAIFGLSVALFEIPTGVSPQTLAQAPDGSIWVANRGSATVSVLSGLDDRGLASAAVFLANRCG